MDYVSYFKSRRGELVRLLKELVHLESPSNEKKAVDECSSFVVREFKKLGAKVTTFPQEKTGDIHLVEYHPGDPRVKKEQLLLLTHVDTVWPLGQIEKMPFYIAEQKVYGPGVLDMKAGIVMILAALRAMRDLKIEPTKKTAIFINSAEEIGSKPSYELIKKIAKKSVYVLCLEPALPGGMLKMQRKGRLVIRLSAEGKTAHAGTPEKGVNAIEELLYHLVRLKQIRTKERTINLGLIEGGEKANIVAGNAHAVLDIRFWNNVQKEIIMRFFKELQPHLRGAEVKYSIESHTPPMEKTKASMNLFKKIKKIAESIDIHLEAGKAGGGSDASIASSLGIPTVDGLGPDGNGIHSESEYLLLPSLIERTALLTELLGQL
ncbi:MAG: M20 family metallopeptidase [Candidatus Aminicenantales bacterium]